MRRPNLYFSLIAIGIGILLTLPTLVQDGMFMDAVLYTSVSHNLSLGIGTFWFPQFSEHNIAGLQAFHEQPPLVFGIQSVFFSLLGSSMYVERFYTLLTLVISAYLVVLLWRLSCKDNPELKDLWWLPVLFWITIPVCFWSYANNMHENTMTVFCLLAALFTLRWSQQGGRQLLFSAGIAVFLASFSKGLPGLFPLSVPILLSVAGRRISFRKALSATVLMLFVVVAAYGVLCIFPDGRESLRVYFFERALGRINDAPTVESRFYIIGRLFLELLPQLILLVIVLFFLKKYRAGVIRNHPTAWLFIGIGLSGSLPLALTLVQKSFYLVPALPFFAIGMAHLIAPGLHPVIASIENRPRIKTWLRFAGVFVLMLSVIYSASRIGKVSRNGPLLHDVRVVGKIVPQRSVISVPPELWNHWDLQCYLMRYHQISIEKSESREYYLSGISSPAPPGYVKVAAVTSAYQLYRKRPAHR